MIHCERKPNLPWASAFKTLAQAAIICVKFTTTSATCPSKVILLIKDFIVNMLQETLLQHDILFVHFCYKLEGGLVCCPPPPKKKAKNSSWTSLLIYYSQAYPLFCFLFFFFVNLFVLDYLFQNRLLLWFSVVLLSQLLSILYHYLMSCSVWWITLCMCGFFLFV